MSRALVLAAHGSRRATIAGEMKSLAARVAGELGGEFESVSCAFLELASPRLDVHLAALVRSGVRRIVVVPLLLAVGRHLEEDVPSMVEELSARNPEVEIVLAPHIGASDELPRLIAGLARR